MRRLARALNVTPMALYSYFRDKDELLDAIIDASVNRLSIPEAGGDWREHLTAVMRWLRAELLRHPEIVKLRLARPMLSPGALRLTEAGMAILLSAGLPPAEAAYAYRVLFEFTFGSVAFGPNPGSDEDRRRTQAALTLLPPEEYPALSKTMTEAAAAMAGDEHFDYGLDCLLTGLESRLTSDWDERDIQQGDR